VNYIQHIHEPRRLLLVWQRPEEDGAARVRRAVAELLRDSAGRVQLRYLQPAPEAADKPATLFSNPTDNKP